MSRSKTLILSAFLTLPVLAFLVHHCATHPTHLHPTGFTVDENVLYMSYAHQYVDQSDFSVFYSNPFDGDPASPRIYFQPVNGLFAALLKAGADPGFTFSLFGLLMAFACIYLGVLIIRHLLPESKHQVLASILFTWGGGLSALAGVGSWFITGMNGSMADATFLADPANGWWGMNWGRTLFIPLEAYYHFLFLLGVYFILKKKWTAAVVLSAFLSISHPFTGIEFLLILLGWLGLEKFIFRNKHIPWSFCAGILAVAVFHYWYYLVYLQSFPEHKRLFSQYSAGWTYSFRVFIPAYAIVAALALLTVKLRKKMLLTPEASFQRLFLCWAVIAFLLSKHEWFMRPMQPIHFTRGYIWAGLFLFALPALVWLKEKWSSGWKRWLFAAFIVLFLLDNTVWIINQLRDKHTAEWEGHISSDTKEVLDYLKQHSTPNDLLTGNATLVNYLTNAYSSANAWATHPYNTPDRNNRLTQMMQALSSGILLPEWKQRRVLVLINKKSEPITVHSSLQTKKLFENNSYVLFTP